MNNIGEIIKFITDMANDMHINYSNYSFDDYINILNQNKNLEQYLDKVIFSPVLEEDIESIKSEFVRIIIRIYIDKKNIEVISKNEEIIDDEETLDVIKLYKRQISKYPVLTREQERELFIAYNNGDMEAKKILYLSNQGIVMSIAKRYVSNNYDYMTAIQDGNLGLSKAIEKFDVSLGYKFSTYATDIIGQYIYNQRILEVSGIVAPKNVMKKLSKYNKLNQEYLNKYRKSLDDNTASSLLNISIDKLNGLKRLNYGVNSLNQMIGDDDDSKDFLYFTEDGNNQSVEDQVMNYNLHDDLIKAMNNLKDREKFVLIQRYGLEDGRPKTLEEVGVMINVKRERVRQIEKKALIDLQDTSEGKALKEYLYK